METTGRSLATLVERCSTLVPERLDTRAFERGGVSATTGFARPLGWARPPIHDYQDRY
jgi:hypothetical protein